MLEHIKRLTKHSAVYGVGHIVSRFVGFLLVPVHTNVFLPEEYRTPALLFASLAILNILFTYGMDVAFLRFFILAESKEEKKRIFSTAFLTILGTGMVFAILMVLHPAPFSRVIFRSVDHLTLIRLAGGILVADALCLLPFLVLRAEERSKQFILLKTLNIAVNFGLNILFVLILRKGIESIFTANLIASGFTLIILMPIILRWLRAAFHRETLMELFRFGLPYIPSTLSVVLMDQVGRFFLDRMAGEEATGIFSAAYKLGMFMALVVAAFRFAWHPFFLSTVRDKPEEAPRVFGRVLTYFTLVTGFFFLLISCFIGEIVTFRIAGFGLVGKDYVVGAAIVPVVMLAYVLYGVYANFIVGIYIEKKTVYLPFITGLGALTSVLGNVLLIPRLGILGAAWSVFFAYAVMAATLYLVSKRLYRIPYEWGRIAKLVGVVAVFFFVGVSDFAMSHAAYRMILVALLVPALWGVGFFTPDERDALRRALRGRRDRGSRAG